MCFGITTHWTDLHAFHHLLSYPPGPSTHPTVTRAVKPLFAALGCQPTIQRVFYQRDDAPAQVALLVDGSAAAASSSSSAAVVPSSH